MPTYSRFVPVCSGLSADDLGTAPAKNSYVTLTNTAGNASYFLKYKRDNSAVGQTVTSEDGVIALRPDADPVGYNSQLGFYELGHVTDRGQATVYKLDLDVRLKNREGWYNFLATEPVNGLTTDLSNFTTGMPFIAFMTGSSATSTYRILNFTVAPWQGRGWLQIDLQSIVSGSSIWKSVMVPESFMNGEPMHITIRTVLTSLTPSSETYTVILELNGKGAGLCYLTGNLNNTAGSRCQGFVVYQTTGTNNYSMARNHAFPYVVASNLVMSRLETVEAAPPTAYITAEIHDTSADLTVHTGVDYE